MYVTVQLYWIAPINFICLRVRVRKSEVSHQQLCKWECFVNHVSVLADDLVMNNVKSYWCDSCDVGYVSSVTFLVIVCMHWMHHRETEVMFND